MAVNVEREAMASQGSRTVEDIRADLARNRSAIQTAVGDLAEEYKPANMAKRAVDDAKTFVAGEVNDAKTFLTNEYHNVKARFVDEDGAWRTEELIKVGAVVAGALVLLLTVRSVRRRK